MPGKNYLHDLLALLGNAKPGSLTFPASPLVNLRMRSTVCMLYFDSRMVWWSTLNLQRR